MDLVASRLRQNQIGFGIMGKEVPDVSGSGEQDCGSFLYAAVSDMEMDYFGRMSGGYAALVKVLVLADDGVAVGRGEVPDIGIINLRHAEKQNVFSPGIFGCENSDQTAGYTAAHQVL